MASNNNYAYNAMGSVIFDASERPYFGGASNNVFDADPQI